MMVSKRPGKDAGLISERTKVLRGPIPLTADERRKARFLRVEVGLDWPDISLAVGRTEEDIRHSLANMRTPRRKPTRVTVNVGLEAAQRLWMAQHPGEPMWQTMNRMLGI